jgi:glycosyltransferase involved in cell wall biosynthesis
MEDWDGITVRRFRYLPARMEDLGYSGGIMPNLKKNPFKLLKIPFYIHGMYREALRLAIEEEFSLVNFHWFFPASFWLGQFVRSVRVPVILTGHGTDIRLAASQPVFKYFAMHAFNRAAAITVNSDFMKNLLPSETHPKINVIPMGVDTEKFSPADTRPSRSKTIVYVGRLIRQKGINLLIEAFSKVVADIPDARLEIIGYGPEKSNVLEFIARERMEKNVFMIDAIPHDGLPAVYRNARILVLPSLAAEGLGMTPAEAGLCGVPTITFGLGGTSEIIQDGQTGIIAEMTAEGLRDALLCLLRDDKLADTMGANARKFLIEKIGWSAITTRFDSLFCSVAANIPGKITGRWVSWTAFSVIAIVTLTYLTKLFFDRFERLVSLFK